MAHNRELRVYCRRALFCGLDLERSGADSGRHRLGRHRVFEVVQRRSAMTRSTEPYRLDGKIALVTGGGSGIGEATCRELCSAGARVMIADIDIDSAAALAGTLDGAREIKMDVT